MGGKLEEGDNGAGKGAWCARQQVPEKDARLDQIYGQGCKV